MSFVKEALPNLFIRPLLDPYRYKHTSCQGFPSTRHEQAVLQHNEQHNDDEQQVTFRQPFMPCIGEWWWLIGKSSERSKMSAASDESISTLKCPDCSLSFSYLPSCAKKPFNLAFTPPPLFFGSIFSLSLSLLPSTQSFLFLSAKASTQKTHPIVKTNLAVQWPGLFSLIHQNNMAIFLLFFLSCQRKWANIALLYKLVMREVAYTVEYTSKKKGTKKTVTQHDGSKNKARK